MAGWVGPAIQAGATIIGSLIGAQGAAEANAATAHEAARNREWQQYMSGTAHTREVADLRNAGLNPILSVNAGASTPAGSTATFQNAMEPIAEGISTAAKDLMTFKMAMDKQDAEIGLIKSQKEKVDTENKVLKGDVPKSEIIQDIYNFAKPLIERFKQGGTTNAMPKAMHDKNEELKKDIPKELHFNPRMFKF